LEHFALGEELGSRSGPHLAHLESCADCRREVGIDRALVAQLRRALRERVEGSAPSGASWDVVRRRTLDRPERRWTAHALHWGGMASAAAAAIMMFAVATAPTPRLFPGTQSPFLASAARRAVPPVEEASAGSPARSISYRAPQADGPLPGWPMQTQMSDVASSPDDEPPITGRMR
jgi:anti-sigma factor RsiW